MEKNLSVAKEAGITDKEIGAVQAIVMAVSAARVMAQFGEIQAKCMAVKRSEQTDKENVCTEAQTCRGK